MRYERSTLPLGRGVRGLMYLWAMPLSSTCQVDCELEAGHDGPHGSHGQQGTGTDWGVRWSLTASEIKEIKICPVALPEPDDRGNEIVCLLFAEHPGRHSFEIESG